MFRKVLSLAAIVLVFSVCELQAEVIHSTWVGGEWGFWEDELNWQPAMVPDNNETYQFRVTINGGQTGTNILVRYDHDVNAIDTYGEVGLERHNWQYAPDLIVLEPNGLTNHNELEIGDEINVRGNVFNMGWLNGWFDVEDGNLANQKNGQIDATDNNIDVHDGNIYNYGSIVTTSGVDCYARNEFHNFGVIESYGGMCSSDDTFINQNTGEISGYGVIHSDKVIENRGFVQSLGGDLALHSRIDFEGPYFENMGITNTGALSNSPGTSLAVMVWVPDVNNEGTIEVNADGSVVFDCNLVNEPNAVIRLLGGTLSAETITQSAGAIFEGFGGITGDLVIEANGVVDVNGPTNIVGDVEIEPNATLEIRDGTTLIRGHTTCNNGTIHMIGGRVICQGGLSNNGCNIIWEPGIYTNIADFNLDGQVNFQDFGDFANTWLWRASWY